jgi:hypothetical protein
LCEASLERNAALRRHVMGTDCRLIGVRFQARRGGAEDG